MNAGHCGLAPAVGDAVQRTAHDLASTEGVDLTKASPAVVHLWEARGLALHALARGDMTEALKVMAPFKQGSVRRG
ncbi:hypothetical protein EDF77_1885 [Stenotrophomonas maltophilia]|uniref:hypothetical protein n=1 Tax=Stenotrophomonas chelatiphaga TaxID=517011 RepID=UPI000F980D99|nr:hypothetical protein [Stenotrophomonas chelatiphaga]MCS4231404.1 hypothetical protein [Stenotrophomonas chelatiphaga]ROQ42413.1 hypothetical protein EDF77_1885 [Stenotrophomonas maltophilia]